MLHALTLSGGQFVLAFFVVVVTLGVLAFFNLRKHVRGIAVDQASDETPDEAGRSPR